MCHPVKAIFAHLVLVLILACLVKQQLQDFSIVTSQRMLGLLQVQGLEAGRHLKLPSSPLAVAEYVELQS